MSESTITMRVKLVSITISAGAIASTVSSRMMTTLWLGLPFGCLLSLVPARLPRSIEIEPLLRPMRCRPTGRVGSHRSRRRRSCRPASVGVVVGVVAGAVIDGGGR